MLSPSPSPSPSLELVPAPVPALFNGRVAMAAFRVPPAEAVARLPDEVWPPELRAAVPRRRADFLAGRQAARAAIAQIAPELAGEPVGIGPSREPIWPSGLCGSITHSGDLAAAAVARRTDILALGLDSELALTDRRAEELASFISSAGERTALGKTGLDLVELLTLIFSAKESLFKCLFPFVGRFFGFADARLTALSLASGHFELCLETDLGPELQAGRAFTGRLAVDGNRFHTGIALPAP